MKVRELKVLRYKDKEVGYRVDADGSLLDVSKEDFDNLGGIDYSSVGYIELYADGNLIASEEEINSGVYVSQAKGKDVVVGLYDSYKAYLGGRLINDKYVLKINEDELFNGVMVYKLGCKDALTSFYTVADYKDILNSVEQLSKDLGIEDVDVEDYGNVATIKIDGVTIDEIEYHMDIDLLAYNVKSLILKVLKYSGK